VRRLPPLRGRWERREPREERVFPTDRTGDRDVEAAWVGGAREGLRLGERARPGLVDPDIHRALGRGQVTYLYGKDVRKVSGSFVATVPSLRLRPRLPCDTHMTVGERP
jgi:hypothetical protein